jgi:hypothetical protein
MRTGRCGGDRSGHEQGALHTADPALSVRALSLAAAGLARSVFSSGWGRLPVRGRGGGMDTDLAALSSAAATTLVTTTAGSRSSRLCSWVSLAGGTRR